MTTLTPTSQPSLINPPLISSLTFLGTGSAVPTPRRSCSSLVLHLTSGSLLLIDCGESTQLQLHRAGVKPTRISTILITHLHGDHFFGLFGLLSTLSTLGRTAPLTIISPPSLQSIINTALGGPDGLALFPIHYLPLPLHQPHDLGLINNVHIRAFPITHTIPAFGYVIEEQQRPGRVNVERAKELRVSGPQMKELKEGKTVMTSKGEVRPSDCLSEAEKPFRVAVVQDCRKCDEGYEWMKEVDVLVHESTYGEELEEKADEHGHSTSVKAGRVGREVGAKALILTHFSTRYGIGRKNRQEINERKRSQGGEEKMVEEEKGGEEEEEEGQGQITTDELVDQAVKEYRSEGQSGPVWAAEDFLVFERVGSTIALKDYAAENLPFTRPTRRHTNTQLHPP